MSDTLRDAVSGLLNEDYFRAALPNRVATARRVLRPISIAVLLVDDHAAAPTVAQALLAMLRESDTACRMADGRFVLLLEDTPDDGAVWTVERVRRLLDQQAPGVTLWAGVAAYPAHALEAADLIARAEGALALAHTFATSRIEVAPPL